MKSRLHLAVLLIASASVTCLTAAAQRSATAPTAMAASNVVPSLINYTGVLKDASGRTLTGVTGVTFLLYSAEQGGAPLWLETQNITPDKSGHYTVQLGTASAKGLPSDLFVSGEARWLAVQIGNEAEQPRALLVAVPYAMKAADAQTLGGLPASAFVLATLPSSGATPAATGSAAARPSSAPPPATSNVTTTGGTASRIPMFTTATNIQNSILTQTGTTAINVGGRLNLPALGTATAAAGFNSRPLDFAASVFNSGTSTAVPQTFQWQAEPSNNNTTTASGTLNLLYATGTAVPAETGLRISSKGLFTFAAGQSFPGTVESVGLAAPSSDFTVSGSPVTGTGTLTIAWNVAPTSANAANAIVKRDGSGNFSASTIAAGAVNAGALFGNGAGVTNVNASALGGLAPGAFAQLAAVNNFTTNQTITGNLTLNGVGNGLTFPDGTRQTTHQIVVPFGINDFASQFGSPIFTTVSYGTLVPVPCWTLPQAAGGTCIIATTVIPPGVTTPTVLVDVDAPGAGTASVNLGSTGVAANAAPPSNCINFNTTQNLTFTAGNTMQRFSTVINTLAVCGSSPPAVAGPGDILVFRICNFGAAGALSFSVTSVEFLWQ